jgi:energy-coupling factor transporter ATP-binding protein EcfA2
MAARSVPTEVLRQSPPERLQFFQRFTVAHPLLQQAKDQLHAALHDAAPGALVFVFGPTGVGKTTLRLRMEQALVQELLPQLHRDRGRLPYVSLEALAPETGSFNWKEHFRRMLLSMNEPLIDYKTVPTMTTPPRDSPPRYAAATAAVSSHLRYAVEQALMHRRPVAVFLDEAQHLGKMASGRKLLDQLDVLKSIANQTRTLHVLIGTYDLLFFRHLSGQLSRRGIDVHVARYRAEHEEERAVFKNVVWTFQHHLPLRRPLDLVTHWELLYERCIGCVGILKEWLLRALTLVFRAGEESLTVEHLERTALSVGQCEQMLAEAQAGEVLLAEHRDARLRLRNRLGLVQNTPVASAPDQDKSLMAQASRTRRKRPRVGQRRATRDRIGVVSHG